MKALAKTPYRMVLIQQIFRENWEVYTQQSFSYISGRITLSDLPKADDCTSGIGFSKQILQMNFISFL